MKIMTLKGAAAYLNMNAEVLRRQAQKGDIPARKLGTGSRSPWRFIQEELDEYMKGNDVQALAEPEAHSVLEKLIREYKTAGSEDKEVMALNRIGRLQKSEAVPFLCEILLNNESSINQIFWSIRAIVEILGKEASRYLQIFRDHADDWIRMEVAIFYALEFGDKPAIAALEEQFEKTGSFLVLQVLLQVKTQKYLPHLQQMFSSEVPHNRLLALRSLKDISYPEEEQELARLVLDNDLQVQTEALKLAVKRKHRSLIPQLQLIIAGNYPESVKRMAAGALAESFGEE
ncbi:MAG: helix-turn-helix domain-containing protein [Candidatus Cloacimonetes bacterium]|nr:helix-turn-helix domain-containing protein [Candidatus Cloacimonadota bacterium]